MMTYLNTECLSFSLLGNTVDILYSYWKKPPEYLFSPMGAHTHVTPEVHYAVNAETAVVIENRKTVIRPGEALLIAPNVIHHAGDQAGQRRSFNYNIHEKTNGLETLIPSGKTRLLSGVNVTYLQAIETESADRRPGYREKISLLFQLCLVDLVQCTGYRIRTGIRPMSDQQYGFLIERYITTHITESRCEEDLTASKENLAQELSLSPRQLERVMLGVFGVTYSEMYKMRKFEIAFLLLHDMKMKVKETSEFLGYADEANFSRAFRNYFGFYPQKLSLFDGN